MPVHAPRIRRRGSAGAEALIRQHPLHGLLRHPRGKGADSQKRCHEGPDQQQHEQQKRASEHQAIGFPWRPVQKPADRPDDAAAGLC